MLLGVREPSPVPFVLPQDINKRLSLPADIRLPEGYLEKLSLNSPLFDKPLSRRLRRVSLVTPPPDPPWTLPQGCPADPPHPSWGFFLWDPTSLLIGNLLWATPFKNPLRSPSLTSLSQETRSVHQTSPTPHIPVAGDLCYCPDPPPEPPIGH